MNYQEHLEEIREQIMEGSFNLEDFGDNIEFYESFIPEFFSKTGEADNIRKMYKDIRNDKNELKTVEYIPVVESATLYTEYIDGMVKFINEIKETAITENVADLDAFSTKFNNAKQNDSAFIESLFNGRLTEKRDVALTEAVSNVEFVIDFISNIGEMKSRCEEIKESVDSSNDAIKTELLVNCYNMMCESVNNYCCNMLKAVIDTYQNINKSLYSESNTTESKEKGFKLL